MTERVVALKDFYTGVRRTLLQADEMLVDIAFPALRANQRGTFVKFALRQAQAISLVNAAVVLTVDEVSSREVIVLEARITLGAVAPTIVHAVDAEEFLRGKVLEDETIREAAERALQAARPISDVRGSAGYRQRMVKVVVRRALQSIAAHKEREGLPEDPVLLMSKNIWATPALPAPVRHTDTRHDCHPHQWKRVQPARRAA